MVANADISINKEIIKLKRYILEAKKAYKVDIIYEIA